MTLRPEAAHWFELLTAHQDLARAMECLSRTGMVELEARGGGGTLSLDALDDQLKIYREMAKRYAVYWRAAAPPADRQPEHPDRMLDNACRTVSEWVRDADPLIAEIEHLGQEIAALGVLREALDEAEDKLPDLALLAGAGPRMQTRLARFDAAAKLPQLPSLALFKMWDARDGHPGARYMLIVGRAADIMAFDQTLATSKGRAITLPGWLPPKRDTAIDTIAERITALTHELKSRKVALAAQTEASDLAQALGDIMLLEWIRGHADKLQRSERLAWVTGWSSDSEGKRLRRALDAANVRYVLRLTEAPPGLSAPMILHNPAWVRGFEVFARMLGIPAAHESDPSIILAMVVPLIFGFMFGDVGQGLVILAAGLIFGARVPLLRILIPGGVSATVFGFLFGSVFCREDIVPALWLHPLEAPVDILIASVAIGVGVLAIGLLLDAVQMHWRSVAHRWWGYRAGLTLAYVGLLATPFYVEALALGGLGAAWFILGSALMARERGLGALAQGAAEFTEEILRLLVNTVSFARIGAFALAHAGLSAAIVDVAGATGPVFFWVVLTLGNFLVIALEGLVVGIQTTRLMLFEFFIRFLTGTGREFKPLPPPTPLPPAPTQTPRRQA